MDRYQCAAASVDPWIHDLQREGAFNDGSSANSSRSLSTLDFGPKSGFFDLIWPVPRVLRDWQPLLATRSYPPYTSLFVTYIVGAYLALQIDSNYRRIVVGLWPGLSARFLVHRAALLRCQTDTVECKAAVPEARAH